MVAAFMAFLGSIFNLVIDTVYKIFITVFVVLLIGFALIFGFTTLIIWLLN